MAKKKKGTKDDQMSAEDLGIPLKPQPSISVIEKEEKIPVPSPREEKKSSNINLEISKKISSKSDFVQSSCNIGMVGHVDHGKTTLVKALSGTWTERYADEINRGITIKLGYAEGAIMECPKCGRIIAEDVANNLRPDKSKPKGMCPDCNVKLNFRRRVSFVDAPGHEILMATMLSGASLMDGALLLISATETCPQPQTREHLAALEIAKIDNIIIVQNKVDAVGKERAYQNYQEIKKFIKGTIAEHAPIIPVSAVFDANIDLIYRLVEEKIKSPELDEDAPFLFNIARSFDVNKPGAEIENLKGGVIGGSIVSGFISVGQEIEIRPGLKKKEGKFHPVFTHVRSIYEGANSLEFARPGGLIALGTELDPSNTRTDQLIGNVAGIPGTLPEVKNTVDIEAHLLEKVLGTEEDIIVDPLRKNESLMIVTGTALSAGTIEKIGKQNLVTLVLKRPICALEGSIVAISRRINNRFRLIGYGYLV